MTPRPKSSRWPVWLLALVLYPLAWGAVAINLFFLALMSRAVGGAAISPTAAMIAGAALGTPAAFWFARWIRRLMDEADAQVARERGAPGVGRPPG